MAYVTPDELRRMLERGAKPYDLLKAAGLQVARIGREIGESRQAVWSVAVGRYSNQRIERAIARRLGLRVGELFSRRRRAGRPTTPTR